MQRVRTGKQPSLPPHTNSYVFVFTLPPSWHGTMQFVIFKPLSYCFAETIGFNVKASFASRPLSRLIR